MSHEPFVHAVGIDLGTTYSAVAVVAATGHTSMLVNELGDVLTPSVVEFAEREVIVGREALKALAFNADCVAVSVKRDMGKAAYARRVRGQSLPPEVIEAYILRALGEQARGQLAGDYQVVITVPAYFDEGRRKATQDAGEMAGLDVLAIINEPTAAALAFGEQLGYLSTAGTVTGHERVLVFDLGGGTFDVTAIELGPDTCRTLATDGDVRLGGTDWDARLADFLAEQFVRAHGWDPRPEDGLYQRLLLLADEAKRTLSARRHATVRAEFRQATCDVSVTRSQFESLTADLVERTMHTVQDVLQQAEMTWADVDRLLLVGGATRMPVIGRRLAELSGMAADQSVNPDEAVARGAAIYASSLLSQAGRARHPVRLQVIDVNSHSLGVEGVSVTTGRRENAIIIPRNTPLPVEVTQKFVTRSDDQPSIVLHVLEGESSDPADCLTIGRAVLRDLPAGLPAGSPLDVTYAYNSDGRLLVRLRVPGTDRDLVFELQRAERMSDAQRARWATVFRSNDPRTSFEDMVAQILGSLPGDSPGNENSPSR